MACCAEPHSGQCAVAVASSSVTGVREATEDSGLCAEQITS